MTNQLAHGIRRAYAERQDLLIIALTGRTGSGCTTAASILSRNFSEISVVPPDEGERGSDPERRKIEIIKDFAAKNWVPFISLSASSVIFSFLVTESSWEDTELLLNELRVKRDAVDKFRAKFFDLSSDPKKESFEDVVKQQTADPNYLAAITYFTESIQPAAADIRTFLGESYASVFQKFGNNLRLSGNPTSDNINSTHLFSLMERITLIIEALERTSNSHTRVVIDAIRNPLELVYLRDKFPQFLAVAITSNESDRQLRLTSSGLNKRDIERLDKQEYPENRKYLDNYESFVSQNLQDCIQKADIFISNSGKPEELTQSMVKLGTQLVRYTCLALRPGIITPTRDERCMQLAFVAKLNSGCISRQVGAAITDENYSVKAVGWNDVPSGQVPCLLRDSEALMSSSDNRAFSDYEKNNKDFRKRVDQAYAGRAGLRTDEGLRCSFCFKQIYNELKQDKNQVHTRSLHAEENAFLQLTRHGGMGIDKGSLYTTASPCELCSKKAYQLGIKEIVFVDPYPGISTSHVLASGDSTRRPRLYLFGGAIGQAYHRLYEPIMNIKDELLARLSSDESLVQPSLV